ITITLTSRTPPLSASETLYVYWTDNDCNRIVTDSGDVRYFGSRSLSTGDPLLTTEPFNFPDDMVTSGSPPEFTTLTALDFVPACPPDPPMASRTFRLCFAIDLVDLQGDRNGTVESGEPNAWVEFTADTLKPPVPAAPGVLGLDSTLRITATVTAAGDKDDIATWRGIIRPLPEDTAEQGQPCDTWTSGVSQTTHRESGPGPVSFEIGATNGVTYEVCVRAIDATDNESDPSPLSTGTPVPSCDFIECYPGELQTGYCGATPLSLWGALAGAWLLRRRRRRQRNGSTP
ncbi:MAG: hypothetical protein HYZ27_09785, partial [Deltaproteobacteria bacterium]|nr:hypothetical protein [Deltaproteobacteria bacterium]